MKNLILLQLFFIMCVNVISSLDKRDVHRIILREGHRSKRHRSPSHHNQAKHRHRQHRHNNHEYNEDQEDNVSFPRSSESSFERPTKYKGHTQKPIKNHSSNFWNLEKPRDKRQKHHWKPPLNIDNSFDKPKYHWTPSKNIDSSFDSVHDSSFISTTYPTIHKDYFQKEKTSQFSTFNPLSEDEFSDFKFYQKFLNLNSLPSTNLDAVFTPNKNVEPFSFNNTYQVYEDGKSTDSEVKHDALRSSSASRFINRNNKVFDGMDNAQGDRIRADGDKQKRNAAIRQRNKKMRDQLV